MIVGGTKDSFGRSSWGITLEEVIAIVSRADPCITLPAQKCQCCKEEPVPVLRYLDFDYKSAGLVIDFDYGEDGPPTHASFSICAVCRDQGLGLVMKREHDPLGLLSDDEYILLLLAATCTNHCNERGWIWQGHIEAYIEGAKALVERGWIITRHYAPTCKEATLFTLWWLSEEAMLHYDKGVGNSLSTRRHLVI